MTDDAGRGTRRALLAALLGSAAIAAAPVAPVEASDPDDDVIDGGTP